MRPTGAAQRGTNKEPTGPSASAVEAELARAVVTPGGLWSRVRVVARTGSTNADVAALAHEGAGEGLVLIAESQEAGRGRMGRSWLAPPGTSLTMSVLLRPGVDGSRLGWLPLLAGVAVAEACGRVPGVAAALKWPNDVLLRSSAEPADGWGKGGGILAEAADAGAVVVGIGVNVSQDDSQLPPRPDPLAHPSTSLACAGGRAGRDALAIDVLRGLEHWYGRWRRAGGDPEASGLRDAYLAVCATLGRSVEASLPGGRSVRGVATRLDRDGRLVVAAPGGEHRLAAGDVHHLRPVEGSVDDPPFQGRVPVAPAH